MKPLEPRAGYQIIKADTLDILEEKVSNMIKNFGFIPCGSPFVAGGVVWCQAIYKE